MTLEEAEEIWNNFECNYDYIIPSIENPGIIQDSIADGVSMCSNTGTVRGKLEWMDDNGKIHPLRRVRVDICRKFLGINWCIATTFTDNTGNFNTPIEENDNVFIKIYAGDGNINVKTPILGFNYTIVDDHYYNVYAGSTVTISPEPIDMSTDNGRAMQISQAVLTARDYAWIMMGEMPRDVNVYYPFNLNSCYYFPVLECITILEVECTSQNIASYAAWDVIMHEYGHHIECLLNIMRDPLVLNHSAAINLADEYNSVDKGARMAWGESWNTVFGLMAQDYYKSYLYNIDTVGDSIDTSYDGTPVNIEYNGFRLGEACEFSVMGVLWDLYDSNNEGKDEITLTHQEYWDLTTVAWTYRFSARANRFYELYSDNPEMIAKFAKNLTYYKLAPSCPTLHNSADVSITVAPSLSWTAEGGSTEYPNNSFDIVVYDTSYNEIIRVEDIENTHYEFNDANWQYALENHGYPCAEEFKVYITVAGSRKEPLLLDSNFSTGPYYSEYLEMSVKTEHNIVYEQVDTNTHKYICHTCDEETTLEHNFEYTSNGDTGHTKACVECGYYETSNHVLRYESQNNLYHNEYCRYCDYKRLLVSHNYTNRYEYYDSENHYGYCLCGVKILQKHSFSTSGNLDICTYCKIEKDHVHSYTYRPAIKGKTHIKECRCGEKNTEACFGAAIFGEPAYCGRCGEEMKFGGIGILSNENEDALLPNDDEEYLEQ